MLFDIENLVVVLISYSGKLCIHILNYNECTYDPPLGNFWAILNEEMAVTLF